MVARKTRTHFLNLTAYPKDWDAHVKTFETLLRSFRSFEKA
jgi:hypothetical protein